MSKVLVIGGGAAGMFAAIAAAENGNEVFLYEKNEKLGKKLFITGKGRCNLTNACDMDTLFASVVSNPRFLYSSFYNYTNQDVIAFFEKAGVATKTERGGRVFPDSDHSSDVIKGLERELKRRNVKVKLHAEVKDIKVRGERFEKLIFTDGNEAEGDCCIVATGGLSYKTTGSTGDGYRFAETMGHTIRPCIPSLVPVETKELWVSELQGLSLRNVEVTVRDGQKKLYQEFGEMLFTHYGVSGPLLLSASSRVGRKLMEKSLTLEIDLKPALDEEALHRRVLRDFEENQNRQFKNAVGRLFPAKLVPVMIQLSGIPPEKKVHVISREERNAFVHLIKHFKVTLTKLRGFDEAIITKGGISTKEINPKTMESKRIKGIYFAGEVLDLDALTGGFNLQIAWSTGYAAGKSIE
ncbi:NAD(P)/FAD-dependent oxidoreductase [Lachnospiraceae bacterium MD308]|nr:NAD(P)/FAD-dependent oxidoreductase [Lachnospiraceae bacterium MD308]